MTLYLNTNAAYKDFQMLRNDKYFVDKSGIIEKVSERIKTKNRYLCITKPRRFGKTSALNMLGAYYEKAYPSRDLFDGLEISKSESYALHLNKYNVIRFSLNELPGIVVELKADSTPEAAIKQIKDRKYCEKLKKENVENIFMVGISYHTDKKEHQCKIEELR